MKTPQSAQMIAEYFLISGSCARAALKELTDKGELMVTRVGRVSYYSVKKPTASNQKESTRLPPTEPFRERAYQGR